jgi:hypothetical protein
VILGLINFSLGMYAAVMTMLNNTANLDASELM